MSCSVLASADAIGAYDPEAKKSRRERSDSAVSPDVVVAASRPPTMRLMYPSRERSKR
jgi:hypothetical protein